MKGQTEDYGVRQADGSTRYYIRSTRDSQIERDERMRERGFEKEYFQLANGKRGYRWR